MSDDQDDQVVYTQTSGTDFILKTDNDHVSDALGYIGISGVTKDTCSKCKLYKEIAVTYNWSDDVNLARKICVECHTKALDKIYGLGDDKVSTEKTLYGDE